MDNLSPEDRSWCMSRIRSKDMKPERLVRSMVHRLGYRFRLHRRDLAGSPDLVLPRYKTAIFVNGCFWHWHPDLECPIAGLPKSNLEYWKPKFERTRIRDQKHSASLQANHWRVLVIWECALRKPEQALSRIGAFLADSPSNPQKQYLIFPVEHIPPAPITFVLAVDSDREEKEHLDPLPAKKL